MAEEIWIAWDILAAVVIFSCVRFCASRGFLRTLVGLLSYVIAAAAARYLGGSAAELLYDRLVREALIHSVEKNLGDVIASGRDFAMDLIESFPEILRAYLPLPEELLNEAYTSLGTRGLIEELIEAAVKGPVLTLLQSLCFMLIFSAALFISRHFSRLFTGVYRVPVIGPLDTFFGGVAGLLQAVLFMFIGAFILNFVILLTGDNLWWLNASVMEDTFIVRFFYRLVL